MKTKGVGHGTGKIILMGEHAVVYGEPAIAFPFRGVGVTATFTQASRNQLTSSHYSGLLDEAPEALQMIQQLTKRLCQQFHPTSFHLTIESTVPAARGMGSSAAVATAITRAFFDWIDAPLSAMDLLEYVNFSESIAHGNPSGIDAATTSGSQPLYFEKGKAFLAFPLNIDAYLLVADTGILGRTREAVAAVAQLKRTHPKQTNQLIADLGKLSRLTKEAIIHNQPQLLGYYMNQAQADLKALTVSNERLDTYIQLALDCGALGAKLTGGGRGGCFIVLCQDYQSALAIQLQLKKAGVTDTWMQGLGVYENV